MSKGELLYMNLGPSTASGTNDGYGDAVICWFMGMHNYCATGDIGKVWKLGIAIWGYAHDLRMAQNRASRPTTELLGPACHLICLTLQNGVMVPE